MARDQQTKRPDNTAVAVVQPTRMQMPAHVQAEYGISQDQWRAVVDAVFPLAKTVGAVLMALAYCKQRNLNIFKRPVHIVPMRVGDRDVETVWPGIAEYRITAQSQEDFDGWDDVEFGPDVTETFKGKKAVWDNGRRTGYDEVAKTVTYPEWARMVVYKMLHGRRVALPGPKVWFKENYAAISLYCDVPNEKWARSPRQMLEKCAEAAALRRAWPDQLGNEYTAEEMEGRSLGLVDAQYVEVGGTTGPEEASAAKATPTRADVDKELEEDEAHLHTDLREEEPVRDGTEEPGPTLAEQAEQHAAEQQQREVWEKPVGFDDWAAFEAEVTTKMKCAANLVKLRDVTVSHDANINHAPDDVYGRLRDLYDEKAQDHREAAR